MRPMIHEHILKIQPYKPGKPNEEVEREYGLKSSVKLASNENCLGPSPKALRAVRRFLDRTSLYPDGGAYYLTSRLSEKTGFPTNQITVGSGTTEIIQLTAMLLLDQDHAAVASDQAFVMYRLAAQAANARTDETPLRDGTTHDLKAMLAAIREDTRVVFIANPNNPTGTYVTRDEMREYFDRVPDHVLTIVDEAYKEYVFADDYPDATDYLRQGKNAMVLRTFSKIHGLAGFRVGYGVTTPELVDGLDRVRSPFNTTSVGQVAALHALDDEEHVTRSQTLNNLEKEFLSRELTKRKLSFIPSVTNFILIDVGMDSDQFFLKLLPRGVIVRPMKGYRFPNHIRLSIGLREENEKFLRALDQVMI